MAVIDVLNKEGKKVKELTLNSIFDGPVNKDVLYYYIKAYRTNQRQGNAYTKTRAEVAGCKAKPWKQKGTGRARAGIRQSPIWRGGGIVFGPRPREYRESLPNKVKKIALLSILRDKVQKNKFVIIDELSFAHPKTKEMVLLLDNLKTGQNVLIVTNNKSENIIKSANNLKKVQVKESANVNPYDIALYDKFLITDQGLEVIEKRLKDIKKDGGQNEK